jgi:hypothetical protein
MFARLAITQQNWPDHIPNPAGRGFESRRGARFQNPATGLGNLDAVSIARRSTYPIPPA